MFICNLTGSQRGFFKIFSQSPDFCTFLNVNIKKMATEEQKKVAEEIKQKGMELVQLLEDGVKIGLYTLITPVDGSKSAYSKPQIGHTSIGLNIRIIETL